jgi:uncharacterized protein (TIGR00251 family)
MTVPPSPAITLAVRVNPRAKRNAVTKTADGSIKVYVTAPPEHNRANEAVVETIAEWLGVKRRQVEIISGATSRNKVVRVTGAPHKPGTAS